MRTEHVYDVVLKTPQLELMERIERLVSEMHFLPVTSLKSLMMIGPWN